MKTAEDLRDELANVFKGLQEGTVESKVAAELANIAGKMMRSAQVELEYYVVRKEKPNIAFLTSKKS